MITGSLIDRAALDSARNRIGLVATSMAFFLAFIYWISRIGFQDNSLSTVLNACFMSVVLLLAPEHLSRFARRFIDAEEKLRLPLDPIFFLLTLAGLAMLGMASAQLGMSLMGLVYVVGLALLALSIFQFFKHGCQFTLGAVTAIGLIAAWLAAYAYGRGVVDPLFLENLVAGYVDPDTLFHSAIANMIKTYGVPSTGLHNVPYLAYHAGSHWFFAQWSKLAHVSMTTFYSLFYAVIVLPGFLRSFLVLILELRNLLSPDWDDIARFDFWLLIGAVFIGIVPYENSFQPHLGMPSVANPAEALLNNEMWIVSESHGFGLMIMCALLALTLPYILTRLRGKKPTVRDHLFLITYPLLLYVLGWCKVPLMLILGAVHLWYLWRRGLLSKGLGMLSALLTVGGGFALIQYSTMHVAHALSLAFMAYWFEIVNPYWRAAFFLITFFWGWAYFLQVGLLKRLATVQDWREAMTAGMGMEVEWVTAFIGACTIPLLFLRLEASNLSYFLNTQQWIAAAFFLARWPETAAAMKGCIRIRRPGSTSLHTGPLAAQLVLFILIASMSANALLPFGDLLKENIYSRAKIAALEFRGQSFGMARLKTSQNAGTIQKDTFSLISKPQSVLNGMPVYGVLRALSDLDRLTIAEKRATRIFIPRSFHSFWHWLGEGPSAMVVPALSGIAMVHGVSEYEAENTYRNGYHVYVHQVGPYPQTMADCCRDIRSWGANHVIIFLPDASEKEFTVSDFNCGTLAAT